jgi:hypothetical protein
VRAAFEGFYDAVLWLLTLAVETAVQKSATVAAG